ncbi:MAG: VTT domain-containing protein [Gammaproteobacteria bacterium]|nr:VTT domain-containing protein [Gammaproteobacteria bacterium]
MDAILHPGSNCWCIEHAERLSVIVDTADYFAAFAEACESAQRQILLVGWDFDRWECLHRDAGQHRFPDQLGAFLAALVRRRNDLNIYLLSWDFNMIYAAERELFPALRLRMQAPRRFHFRLDGTHPGGASHHQKVVVIDDRIAFVGGIDLSRWRWDTPEHKPDDPRRIDPNGNPYPPFHDLMMLVEGAAAARLGELARERWRRAHDWEIPTPRTNISPWPHSVQPGLHDLPVAIARTEPAYSGRQPVHEVRQLYLDAIASAQHFIYIENQYFTARCLGEAISQRLQQKNGPEVVMVLPEKTGGWLEQMTMDVLRGRIVQRMQASDRYDRLRVCYPHQPGLGDTCISVHAKLLIVDDHLLRIGSSNTSSRSMGLDTECDLAIETQQANDDTVAFIRRLRQQLLGEHLGCEPAQVAASEQQHGSLIAAIEALQCDQRSLRPLDVSVPEELDDMVPESDLIDPAEPLVPEYLVNRYVPKQRRPLGRKRLLLLFMIIIGLLLLAAAWRWTPLQQWITPERLSNLLAGIASPEARAAVAIGGITLASLLMVPLTLLAVVAGIVFSSWQAFCYMLVGALLSSVAGFGFGQMLGHSVVKRLDGSKISDLSKQVAKRGTVAIAILRLLPIAPFAIFNLMAGASHVRFRQFFLGSLLGLTPGLGAITLFSSNLWAAITNPSWINLAVVGVVGAGLLAFGWTAERWLRSR